MLNRILLIFTPILICCTSNNTQQNGLATSSSSQVCINDSCKFVKIDIADKYLDSILFQYSKMYDFNGDGVILATIKTKGDTIRYFANLFLGKGFFEYWLADKKFVFYDTVGNRIAILFTGFEEKLKLSINEGLGDTILNKYLRDKNGGGIYEIWQIEYTRVDNKVKANVFYDYPF